MIKRYFLAIAAVFLVVAGSFADVHVKAIDSSNVEITFTYKDDTATQMNVIGSFDGWTVPGEAMTKNAQGLWEYNLKAKMTDEIQYKFYNNGSWIFDFKAPDKKDDGFGGNNGLIVVADLLASQAASSGASSGFAIPVRKKIAFGTLTWVESDTSFNTSGGAFDAESSKITSKSLWRYSGDLVPGMPGYIEVQMADGSSTIWQSGSLDVGDGLKNLASGVLFQPAFYLGGAARPVLNQLHFGFTTPYVNYDTGYGDYYFPAHTSVLWDTVRDSSTDTNLAPLYAGTGYGALTLGKALSKFGDATIDAGFVPNNLVSDKLGFFSYASYTTGTIKADLEYEMRANTATNTFQMFQSIPRQDVILGGRYAMDQIKLQGQFLLSSFTPGSSADASALTDKIAGEIKATYNDFFDNYEGSLDLRYRGAIAQMLYADNDSILGSEGTMAVDANGYYRIGHWVTAKLDTTATFQNAAPTTSDIAFSVTPGTALDFSVPARRPLTADLYGVFTYDTVPSSGSEAFAFTKAGAKFSVGDVLPGLVKGIDLYYGLDNADPATVFNTLLAEVHLSQGITAQAGVGYRSGTTVNNAVGIAAGIDWTIPLPKAMSPILYSQFVYNMDPYDGTERTSYAFDSSYAYLPDGGASKGDGSGALRVGLKWEF